MSGTDVAGDATRQRLQVLFLAAKEHWDAGRLSDAIPLFKDITRLDPNSPQGHHDLGLAFLRSGQLAEAAVSLQRAVELGPGFDKPLRHLAFVLEQEGRDPEAVALYRSLSQSAGDALDRRHYSAKALAMEGKLDAAERELRGVLSVAPHYAGTRALLGQLLSERGRFDEALSHLSEVVGLLPGAFRHLTAVKRMNDADRPLIERMRILVERPDLDVAPRISVHFGLGKAFDDLGDYATAMRHYESGNRLRAMTVRLNRAALVRQYDSMITGFTAEALSRAGKSPARPASPGDDLPVFIVGMPRSGTTLIEQILSSHSEVAAAGELSFWKDQVDSWRASGNGAGAARALSETTERYRTKLREVGPKALRVIDKAPRNFELLWLIRLAFPDARIIHCRRHPVDTCLSIFFTNFAGHQDYAYDRGDLVFFYRQYERLMDHWRHVLPTDRFTEVHYETLIEDREAVTRRLIAFCGLDWDEACLAPERNTRVVRTASLWQARQPVYTASVERWRRYEPWLDELGDLLPGSKAATL